MQVQLSDMYEKVKNELALMHERALMAEVATGKLEERVAELEAKLPADVDEDDDDTSFLEKLKQEIPDAEAVR